MKTIISMILSAALLMTALTACGTDTRRRVDEARARITPTPTARPVQTAKPEPTTAAETAGEKAGEAARNAGETVGNALDNAGDAAGEAAKDAGETVGDMFDGSKTGTGRVNPTPKP